MHGAFCPQGATDLRETAPALQVRPAQIREHGKHRLVDFRHSLPAMVISAMKMLTIGLPGLILPSRVAETPTHSLPLCM